MSACWARASFRRDRNHWRDRRADRSDDRDDRRDGRRWDRRAHKGYNYHGRRHYGPPPAAYRDVYYGYLAWRRGDRLPSYYRNRPDHAVPQHAC